MKRIECVIEYFEQSLFPALLLATFLLSPRLRDECEEATRYLNGCEIGRQDNLKNLKLASSLPFRHFLSHVSLVERSLPSFLRTQVVVDPFLAFSLNSTFAFRLSNSPPRPSDQPIHRTAMGKFVLHEWAALLALVSATCSSLPPSSTIPQSPSNVIHSMKEGS